MTLSAITPMTTFAASSNNTASDTRRTEDVTNTDDFTTDYSNGPEITAQSNQENTESLMENSKWQDYIQPPKHYKTLDMMFSEGRVGELPLQGPPPVPVSGTRKLLVILVRLSDVAPAPGHTTAYFDDRFFDTTTTQRT